MVAGVHLVGVLLTAVYVASASQTSGQAVLVWALWAVVDIPVSLLAYTLSGMAPVTVHAVFGTLWWYLLAMVAITIAKQWRSRASQRVRNDAA